MTLDAAFDEVEIQCHTVPSSEPPDRQRGAAAHPVAVASVVTAVVIVLTLLRLGLIGHLADQGIFTKYSFFAQQILAGDVPLSRLGDLSPGYLWTVTVLLGMGCSLHTVTKIQITLVSVIALACGWTARRLTGSTAAGITALVCVLGYRAALVNASELEPETLILALNASALCCLLIARSGLTHLLAGVLLGLSAITRPSALLAGFLFAAYLITDSRRAATRARSATLLFILGLLLPVAGLRMAYASMPDATTVMNPGTVLYEGWNPATTGLMGTAPQVVKDLEAGLNEPDALHTAYRRVASVASSSLPEPSNLFWFNKTRAFVVRFPRHVLSLALTKLRLQWSSYEAYDLQSMVRKDWELRRLPSVPFGLLAGAAVCGLAARRRQQGLVLGVYWAAYSCVMLLFYVTARQRNALVPALALLAALGTSSLIETWRARHWKQGVLRLAVMGLIAALAAAPGAIEREDEYSWMTTIAGDRALVEADQAAVAGRTDEAVSWRAEAALSGSLVAAPPSILSNAIDARIATNPCPSERFDLALASLRIHDWERAQRALTRLDEEGYRPHRGAEAVSSVAYYLARCAVRLGHIEDALDLLERARRETPGSADVLALSAALEADDDRRAAHESALAAIHDPYTALLARAYAAADVGARRAVAAYLKEIEDALPEWYRPRLLLALGQLDPAP